MVGEGKIKGDKNGTLEFAVHNKSKYPYLWDSVSGSWATSKTVRNVFIMGAGNESFSKAKLEHNEFLTVKGSSIGPELGIGWSLNNYTNAPQMMLKSCIGNRALGWDLLPPGSPEFDYVRVKQRT